MTTWIQTHTYDGQLPQLDLNCQENVPAISELRHKIEMINPLVLTFFDVIVRDKGRPPNFDPTNNLDAYYLLNFIAVNQQYLDYSLFIEQLQDMNTGFCPQGRTTRLYQIIIQISDIINSQSTPTSTISTP